MPTGCWSRHALGGRYKPLNVAWSTWRGYRQWGMFRHQFRAVVKLGEFEGFLAAASSFNAEAAALGLPPFRVWVSVFGDLNEVWAEADFASLDEHWSRFCAAHQQEAFRSAFEALCAHLVPGSAHDQVMEPLGLSPTGPASPNAT